MDTIVDNGDGTETLTVTEEGLVIATETRPRSMSSAPVSDPTMLDQLAAIGAALLADPEGFASMVAQVAGSNTAKGPLVYLADALKAAEQT